MTLRIDNATIGYDSVDVLQCATAQAMRGRITALIGPNAAGKTTLLRCAAGLLRPKRGAVRIDDASVHAMPPRALALRIAYMPQRPRVSGGLSVRAVVELGRYALAADEQAVHNAIERLDLAAISSQRFAELSVGQQQRVVLARALAQMQPDGVLILDEPTAAVDLAHTCDFMQLLRGLADGGALVLCAMHDLTLAAGVADDVWLVHDGTLEHGNAKDVMQPERLANVFGVEFAWLPGPDGSEVLFADVSQRSYTHLL